ncbi:hypothetical protein LOTGIDRAFT_208735 [Lottia gigantea]|uniref:Nidogen-1 n=1 Tax=Lottia gigantea TaxID=225164 RepID=V4ART3_LOTGI|nr:hypothetical protein LOTGIDRAFT_208735 [Lottia gigantea]ESO97555.1 hypothetical protein LOTGIDRAFT_208735 [Lottia gigantea]
MAPLYLALCMISLVHGVPLRLFYSYGENARNNVTLNVGDDVSSDEVTLNTPIAFYENYYRNVYINVNGHLSFETELPDYRATLVLPIGFKIIAVYLSDVDTRGTGKVYYRETQDKSSLQRAALDIQTHFTGQESFEPTSLFIVTWDKVGYYKQGTDKTNTFQLVIASDGRDSFAIFNYLDNGMGWVTGDGKTTPSLPDVPAQAGFDSGERQRFVKLPNSGTTTSYVNDTNVNVPGSWMFHIGNTGGSNIASADLNTGEVVIFEVDQEQSCLEGARQCHINAKCVDFDSGFCCECQKPYYGNGRQCLEPGVPQRLNGKVFGTVNGYRLQDLDQHTYVVTSDGRAYTAISRVPPELGVGLQTLNTLGGVIGWMFATQIHPSAKNGYAFTGGEFNRTVTVTFFDQNNEKKLRIYQYFFGHDALNNMRMESRLDGVIPQIPIDAKVSVDDYKENYKKVAPGVIKSFSTRTYRINEVAYRYTWDQTIYFKECMNDPMKDEGEITQLSITRSFVVYNEQDQVVRYAGSNKVGVYAGQDPCSNAAQNCDSNADCIPVGESYRCACRVGYGGDGVTCQDVDECSFELNTCDENARCFNVPGSFQCQCENGYLGDGIICRPDLEECGGRYCDVNAICSDRRGRPMCECKSGFAGNGIECYPVEFGCNEADICGENAECIFDNDDGKYRCECMDDFSGDGIVCEPTRGRIDCEKCDSNAQCNYDVERFVFRCQCNAGFTGNGYSCSPLDDCSLCDPNADCLFDRTENKNRCYCRRGFYGDGNRCQRYDCQRQQVCDPNADCVKDGEFNICECKSGFRGDGRRCVVAECNIVNNCDVNAQCIPDQRDTRRYLCQCNPGYEGDGRVCIQRVVPCNQVNNCSPYAECLYNPDNLSYRCRCGSGYQGDGYQCRRRTDLVDCNKNSSLCDSNASCLFLVDQYACVCNDKYRGNGARCVPIVGKGNYLIYAQGYKLMKTPHDSSEFTYGEQIVSDPEQLAIAVETDCKTGYLYWTDVYGGQIKRSNLDGSNSQVILDGLSSPEGLAVDYVSGNIYYTDSGLDVIGVSKLDGSAKSTLFKQNLENPRSIVIDVSRSVIYWTDWNRNGPKIERGSMDGSERKTIVETDLGLPNGLAIDVTTQQLCWADAGARKIECARSDGVGRRIIYDQAQYPFGLTFVDNVLYWTDWEKKQIISFNRDTGASGNLNLAPGGNGKLYGITAVRNTCPQITNACSFNNGGCRFLCLPTPRGGRKCMCADNVDPRRCNEIFNTSKK